MKLLSEQEIAEVSGSGFWSDVGDFAGDFVKGIGNIVVDVATFVATSFGYTPHPGINGGDPAASAPSHVGGGSVHRNLAAR